MTDTDQPDPRHPAPHDLATPQSHAPTEKATERPHPVTPLIRGWVVLVVLIPTVGKEFIPREGQSLPPIWVLLAIVGGLAVLSALVSIWTWYNTRFIIDDEELRIERGAISKKSTRIGFGRVQSVDLIQPLAARLFGLAELRIDAGGKDSSVTLRYLTRAKAVRFRDYLLARAHGQQVSLSETADSPLPSRLEDRSESDQVLVQIQPPLLIAGLLTSSDFLIMFALMAAALITSIWFDQVLVALGGLIPLVMGTLGLIGRRVIAQFNYTLSSRSRPGQAPGSAGLRITRGLTNLTSQSIPLDRVQGIRITRPALWRPLGFYRVDIEVFGYGSESGSSNQSSASSMLFPVARRRHIEIALANLLPGADAAGVRLAPAARQARWLRPFSARNLRHGYNEQVIVEESGWLGRVRDIVPHAKTQSVRLTAGPLQRRLGLTTVHVDTTPGPVHFAIPHLSRAVAAELAFSQLERAQHARELQDARTRQQVAQPPRHSGSHRYVPGEPVQLPVGWTGPGRHDQRPADRITPGTGWPDPS